MKSARADGLSDDHDDHEDHEDHEAVGPLQSSWLLGSWILGSLDTWILGSFVAPAV
jgi:hypothetical protein